MPLYFENQRIDGGGSDGIASGDNNGVTLEQVESAIDEAIGDINAVLDAINGEVV